MIVGMSSAFAVSADVQTGAITPDTSWYSDDLQNTTTETFVLMDAADLLGFAKILSENDKPFSGDTVKLGADIDLNPGWTASETCQAPANVWPELAKQFTGTFDGRGYTIRGIYQTSTRTSGAVGYDGIFGGQKGVPATVKNLNIENSYSKASQLQGHGFLFGHVTAALTIENVYVDAYVVNDSTTTGDSGMGGLIGGVNNTSTTIKNAVFAGSVILNSTVSGGNVYVGGLMGRTNGNSNKLFENCAFYGSVNVTARSANALIVSKLLAYQSSKGYTNTFKNCIAGGTVNATGPDSNSTNKGTVVGEAVGAARYNSGHSYVALENVLYTAQNDILGCCFNQNTQIYTKSHADAANFYDKCIISDPAPISAKVEDSTLKGSAASATLTANSLTAAFGTNGEGYVLPLNVLTTPEEEVPEDIPLEIDGLPDEADISWYRSSLTQYTLADAGDFLGYGYILANVTNAFEGKVVKLAADIDLNTDWDADASEVSVPSVVWPVSGGEHSTKFAGTLDGQGHTVKGLYVNATIERAGLFGTVEQNKYACIKNINIVNSYIQSSKDGVGGLFGTLFGNSNVSISGVYCDVNVVNTLTTANKLGTAGIVAGASWINTGALNLNIENTVYAGNISTSYTEDSLTSQGYSGTGVAGIFGYNNGLSINDTTKVPTINITNCAFYGSITGTVGSSARVGGIVGYSLAARSGVNISKCISAGKIESTGIMEGYMADIIADAMADIDEKSIVIDNVLYTGETGLGGSFAYADNSTPIKVESSSIKGAAADAVLTEKEFTSWSSTDSGYPLPTAIKSQTQNIDVPVFEPGSTVTPPAINNNNNNNDDEDEDETKETSAETSADEETVEIEEKKGCGSSIFGGMATVLCASVAVVAIKKKKE